MRFLHTILLVVFIGYVSANPFERQPTHVPEFDQYSEFSMPSDEKEVEYLPENQVMLKDLCTITRDDTKEFLKNEANSIAASLFNAVGRAADKIYKAEQEASREVVEKMSNRKDQEVTEEAQEELSQSMLAIVYGQLKSGVAVFMDLMKKEFDELVSSVREEFGGAAFRQNVEEVCVKISYDLRRKLEKSFNDFKSEQMKAIPKSQVKQRNELAMLQFTDMKCLTASRVITTAKVCDTMKVISQPILQMLG